MSNNSLKPPPLLDSIFGKIWKPKIVICFYFGLYLVSDIALLFAIFCTVVALPLQTLKYSVVFFDIAKDFIKQRRIQKVSKAITTPLLIEDKNIIYLSND